MNMTDRVCAKLFEVAQRCPLCGTSLVYLGEVFTEESTGRRKRIVDESVKVCPLDHGALSIEVGEYGPYIAFTTPESLYADVE